VYSAFICGKLVSRLINSWPALTLRSCLSILPAFFNLCSSPAADLSWHAVGFPFDLPRSQSRHVCDL